MPFMRMELLVSAMLLIFSPLIFAHGGIEPLRFKGEKIPVTPGLLGGKAAIIKDQNAAIQLGKALFWDMNVGSDGVACASCHFHAGADSRTRNQLAPGRLNLADPESGSAFDQGGVNDDLKVSDFPFFRFSDPNNKASALAFSTDDVVGSAGAFLRSFERLGNSDDGQETCYPQKNEIFHVADLNARQVTNRNAPTVINAAFNFRNFWDGRANNVFNGQTAFGRRDTQAKVWVAKNANKTEKVALYLTNASLASQAVAPPLDMIEMSCQGRTFQELGKKLLALRPLASQQVHLDDSVLGDLRHESGYGLTLNYADLIKKAFADKFWSGKGDFGKSSSGESFTQSEANFAFFFGLAIQLYENTLISDQAPFDAGLDEEEYPVGFTAQQKRGLNLFLDAHCANCHSGPLFTEAINPEVFQNSSKKGAYAKLVDRTVLGEQSNGVGVDNTLIDIGFANTSVVPDSFDSGLGGKDPFGNPLSLSDQFLAVLSKSTKSMLDPVKIVACDLVENFTKDFSSNELVAEKLPVGTCNGHKFLARVPSASVVKSELAKSDQGRLSTATKGAFKIPTLRNVELTGPYMHNGGMKSLEEVVEFYNRGGNLQNRRHSATLVFDQGFSAEQQQDLVAFLKTLTDERVRWERAPFDHPSLRVAHGHQSIGGPLGGDLAQDDYLDLPAVGRNGLSAEQKQALKPFESYLSP